MLGFSGAGDVGASGAAVRSKPRIIPGMWFSGLKAFPKFLICSRGVGVEADENIELPEVELGVASSFCVREPGAGFLALPLLFALSTLRSRGVLRPPMSSISLSSGLRVPDL